MTNYIHQKDSQFLLKATNWQAAADAVNDKLTLDPTGSLDEELLRAGWEPSFGDGSDVVDLQWQGGSDYGDQELLTVIAPFVEEGSYLQMFDEDGNHWRWVFTGGTVKLVEPQIIWP